MTQAQPIAAAVSRNIGWVTQAEQRVLQSKRVAVAGLGGVGGSHLLVHTRLGIGAFNIADFDRFEEVNFNRQVGATRSNLNRPKVDVLGEMIHDINPQADVRRFPEGVTPDNVRSFLEGVDLYIDGLDFFAVDARRLVFATCHEMKIPAVTAAPLGMGAALLVFVPGKGMSFEDYFGLEGQTYTEQLLRFLVGVSPAMLQGGYLVDPTAVDLPNRKGPSTPMGCELCAGIAGTETMKILLGRGRMTIAPWGLHFDAYRQKLKRTWRPGGNRNPIQKLALMIARKRYGNAIAQSAKA